MSKRSQVAIDVSRMPEPRVHAALCAGEVPCTAHRPDTGTAAKAADRSPWRAICLETIALASAAAVFTASAVDAPAAPTLTRADHALVPPPPAAR